jgi:hypothetical protein
MHQKQQPEIIIYGRKTVKKSVSETDTPQRVQREESDVE